MTSRVRTRSGAAGPLGAALALLFLGGESLWAQAQGTIRGQVTEAGSQRPLANAQVFIDGTTIGTLSDNDGRYILPDVPAGENLVRITLIGYSTRAETVDVGAGETVTLDIELRQSALQLDQIVVTGAGVAQERRRLGNTIATVDVGQLETAPVQNLSEVLQGREPGVMGLPSGGMSGEGSRIRIRGSASLSQSNEPIVYVDGVRVDRAGDPGGLGGGSGGFSSRLDDLNPESIERIEVLKGAAAATLYGTEASNGVIQIFTKRGQSGAAQYTVQIEQGFSNYPIDRFKNHAGFVMAEGPTSGRPQGTDIGAQGVRDFYGIDVQPFEVFEVDQFSKVFGTGHQQTYSLSVTGGTESVTYFVSGRFNRDNGPYRLGQFEAPGFRAANDESERRQFNANMEIFPMDDLRLRVSSFYTELYHERPDVNNNIYGVVSSILNSRPELATERNLFGSGAFSTTRENAHRRTWEDMQRFGGSLTAIYSPTPQITLDATVGIDMVNQQGTRHLPFGWNVDQFTGSNVDGWRRQQDRNHRVVTLDLKGRWGTTFGDDWSSELVVGAQGFLTRTHRQHGTGQEFPGPGLTVVGAGAIENAFEAFLEEAQVGVLAQNQFGWRDFAFFTVGARYDEHSAFGETAGGALYPKVSLSVIPSQLDGWRGGETVSTFRVRGAVGTSGLQPGAFDQFTTFSPLAAETGPGVSPLNLGNPDLKPETSLEWELGAEGGFFDDRASIELTYWNRTVTDVLVDRQFAPSGGFRFTQLDNIGELQAEGVDIGMNFVAVTRPNFSANLFANGAFIREEITDLGGAPPLKVGGSYPRYRQFTMEGFYPGSFFGPVIDESVEFPIHLGNCKPLSRAELLDFLSVPRDPGEFAPYVVNCGSPEMLENYLGKPYPNWQGAFGGNFTFYNNFTLNTLFEYRAGDFWIHDLDGAFRRSHPLIGRNVRESAELEAILMNPASSAEQRLEAADRWVREREALSPYDGLNEVHRADFIRLRELSLTYRAPASWADRVGARSLSFTASGRNLALWTEFPGRDPEINEWGRGTATGGLSENFGEGTVGWGVPMQRRFTFQLRAGF